MLLCEPWRAGKTDKSVTDLEVAISATNKTNNPSRYMYFWEKISSLCIVEDYLLLFFFLHKRVHSVTYFERSYDYFQ